MSISFVTPWNVAHQAPLSMGFPRQEYWSGLPLPSPGDLPDPGIEPKSPAFAGEFWQPCLSLGDLPKPGSNPGLLRSLPSEHQGSSEILKWVAYPFSRGSPQPRNQTMVSCIADGFFTS